MASPLSDIGRTIAQLDALRVVEDAVNAEAKFNKKLADSGRPPERLLFTAAEVDAIREEHKAALAEATSKKPAVDYYAWKRRDEPVDFDEAALIAEVKAWEAEVDAVEDGDGRRWMKGMILGFKHFDPRWQVIKARQAERQRLFDATPEGRAVAAWKSMLRAARKLQQEGEVPALDDDDETGAAPVKVPKPKREAVSDPAALASQIARAAAIARGEITPLPSDPTARAIIRAAAKARNEKDPTA